MDDEVKVEADAGVLQVRLNRPSKKNALTSGMYARMADAVQHAQSDPAVRVLLFTGGPKDFTAGNDLVDFLDPARDASAVTRFLKTLPELDKPVVAAVNGYAVGIGTTMLLHCDLVYVGRSAKLRMPFVGLGLVPEFGASLLLPRLVGSQRAASLLLLGETLGGEQAVDLGLATEALADDAVQARALAQARELAARPPDAVQATKKLLRAEIRERLQTVIDKEMHVFAERLRSPEAREAMGATLEKRKPDFSKL
ncbi:MAG: enoyl-CoA hydratase-related protein [Myxococcales bacterium]|nr:enoyl-CoA hydratase-related protein [Myxococcales bacterium]